jgi:hypothetical protein
MITPVALALISPTVAIAIAFWGFRRATRADKLRAFFEVYDRYLANDARSGRRVIHGQLAGRTAGEIAGMNKETLASAGYALAVMNSIAIACKGRYVDGNLVNTSMGRSFASTIIAAKTYIDYLEQLRGFRPYSFAEDLATQLTANGTYFLRGVE